MKQIRYSIAPDIFEKCPGYRRGLVVATNINNAADTCIALEALRVAEEELRSTTNVEAFLASEKVTSWREAFKQFGMNPSEFRPAHEALVRRALQGKPLPNINPAVNIGNALSLRHQIPVGVHPLDTVKSGMELRVASGDESFIAFGSDKHSPPRIGEVVLADGNTVISRCWVWRQAQCSVTLPMTQGIVVNIDCLALITQNELLTAFAGAEKVIRSSCGGDLVCHVLSVEKPEVMLSVPKALTRRLIVPGGLLG